MWLFGTSGDFLSTYIDLACVWMCLVLIWRSLELKMHGRVLAMFIFYLTDATCWWKQLILVDAWLVFSFCLLMLLSWRYCSHVLYIIVEWGRNMINNNNWIENLTLKPHKIPALSHGQCKKGQKRISISSLNHRNDRVL